MEESRPAVVEMRSITKRFLDVTANDRIDFSISAGEICALLGENGAGKTTLMNILFGYYGFDEGEIRLDGRPATFASPRDAISGGIGMIHQHFTLVPTQTVLENIIIGTGKGLFIDYAAARKAVRALGERFGLAVDPDAFVVSLSIGEQQKVEILKALYRNARVLIMDEPTAVLSPTETAALFKTLKAFAAEGRAVVFISHKLNEVMDISDRVVVLRNGSVVAEVRTANTDVHALATLMVGREAAASGGVRERPAAEPVLEVEGLRARNDQGVTAVKGISFTVRRQEILGIAGVSGNGQSELAEALFGLRRPEAGRIRIGGRALEPGRPAAAVEAGMGRVPEDRIETGLLMDLSVEENLILERHSSPRFSRRGLVRFAEVRDFAEECIARYSVKTEGRTTAAKNLSGGNLQKVILARELDNGPAVLVACQPTRGLDVGATEYVHARIVEERDRGAAVVLISDDLDEVFALSDRLLVMYEGEILGTAAAGDFARERIGLWMSGVRS